MNKVLTAMALAAGSTLALSACYEDGYYGASIGWGTPYAYNGWYDGYYGNIYDGYWGSDDYFYYRTAPDGRSYRRADREHFSREAPRQGNNFREWRGEVRPQQNYDMPNFRGGRPGEGNGRDRDGRRDHDRSRNPG